MPLKSTQMRSAGWLALCAMVFALLLGVRSVNNDLDTPRDQSRSGYAGSNACRSCHPQHHESWHRTFHRTMTQQASDQSVLGDFDNARLDYGGIRAVMTREDGKPVMRFSSAGGAQRWQATIERTVGSHRVQQYLARSIDAHDGRKDTYVRLPVAWDVQQRRWFHMNGAFLTPDPAAPHHGAAIARADYDRHVTRWNDNCVFCHNVAPNPGLQRDGRFNTRTAELGVACEACHGPGAEHARDNCNPLRRYALHLSERRDHSIANPERMSAERSAQVCGRCHGQRKAADIDRVLREGDTFTPGTDLSAHSVPLARDTTLNGESGHFAPRFWNDGTPRLTAYEYQGLLQSPCAARGELHCGSCHSMHASDANLQLRSDLEERTRCTQCHTELRSDERASAHSHHSTSSTGNRCQACHMPRIAYGVIGARISHRIEIPSPAQHEENGRPDACTLCHITRDRAWAIDAVARWRQPTIVSTPADLRASPTPQVALHLFAGDPIERAVALGALGDLAATERDEVTLSRRRAWLLDVLTHDRYPALRQIARSSLIALLKPHEHAAAERLRTMDTAQLSLETRARDVATIADLLKRPTDTSLSTETIDQLRSSARTREIEIGE